MHTENILILLKTDIYIKVGLDWRNMDHQKYR